MTPAELRAWSDEITQRHLAEPLLGRYRVARVDEETWKRSFDLVRQDIFPGDAHLDLSRAWSEDRLRRFDDLNALLGEPIAHHLILHDQEQDDAPMAWFHGAQDMWANYTMAITGVHPAWRGRKIYPAFLARMLGMLDELGFREVRSRHQANNNAVLIPKLRAGFQIAAFEVAPSYGFLVHLRYTFSEAMRAVYAWRMDARVGSAALIRERILTPEELP